MEFSAKMQQKFRVDAKAAIKCKSCVASAELAERELAAAAAALRMGECEIAQHQCASCGVEKPASAFSRAQLNKASARRCSTCQAAEAASAAAEANAEIVRALADARAASADAEVSNASAKLGVFARETAMEAALVTGLKPRRVGGRGRGRGRNANSALGRGGRAPPV